MIPTIRIFTQALLTPDLSFETLGDARAVLGADGLPVLRRTTRFVEAEIEWRGTRHLLSLPLNPSAMFRIERTATALRKINCPALTEYRILPHELHWQDAYSNLQISDLVLQPIPIGGGIFRYPAHRIWRDPIGRARCPRSRTETRGIRSPQSETQQSDLERRTSLSVALPRCRHRADRGQRCRRFRIVAATRSCNHLLYGTARYARGVSADIPHLGAPLGRQSVRRVDLRRGRNRLRIRRPRQPSGHRTAISVGRRFPRRPCRSADSRRAWASSTAKESSCCPPSMKSSNMTLQRAISALVGTDFGPDSITRGGS